MRGLHSHQDLTPFEVYIQKTYCKTGALIANSCKAAAILGSQDPQVSSDQMPGTCWSAICDLYLSNIVSPPVSRFTV